VGMRLDASTLSAKLRPNANQARLSAEELVPLCDSIRKMGYGVELDGILHRYILLLQGRRLAKAGRKTMMSHVMKMGKGMSVLMDWADRGHATDNPEEIRRLMMMIRTEMLPEILQMESLLDRRLKRVNRTRR